MKKLPKGSFFMSGGKFSRLHWSISGLETPFTLTHQTSGKA
jgi:hypothetical protein